MLFYQTHPGLVTLIVFILYFRNKEAKEWRALWFWRQAKSTERMREGMNGRR